MKMEKMLMRITSISHPFPHSLTYWLTDLPADLPTDATLRMSHNATYLLAGENKAGREGGEG